MSLQPATVTALTGQAETQLPQPVQSKVSITERLMPLGRSVMVTAAKGQTLRQSPQPLHFSGSTWATGPCAVTVPRCKWRSAREAALKAWNWASAASQG